MQAEDFFHGL